MKQRQKLRGYEAAEKNKGNQGWKPIDSKNYERSQIDTLRTRAKDLFKNTPYAKQATKSNRNNAISTGILPAIKDGAVKVLWDIWAESIECDFDENLNFYGLQALAFQTMQLQGGVLILRIRTKSKGANLPLELKLVPVTYLDKTKDSYSYTNGRRVVSGIEYNEAGKLAGFWIYDNDPDDSIGTLKSTFWDKKNVIHLFDIDEPGQIVGVPNGVQSFPGLKDFSQFTEAEIRKQVVAACFAAFVAGKDPDNDGDDIEEDDLSERIEPGLIQYMNPGEEITFSNPPKTDNYGDFSRVTLTSIASGFGTTYEAMTGDLSNVNFSSGRMGRLELAGNIQHLQWNIFIPKFCNIIWKWFKEAAELSQGTRNIPERIIWTAPKMPMVDPTKETRAIIDQIRSGLISWQEGVRLLGYSPDEIIKEMIEAKKIFDESGLMPESDPRFDASRKEEPADTEGNENDSTQD